MSEKKMKEAQVEVTLRLPYWLAEKLWKVKAAGISMNKFLTGIIERAIAKKDGE